MKKTIDSIREYAMLIHTYIHTYKAYARKEVQSRTSFYKKRGDRYLISGHFGDVYA